MFIDSKTKPQWLYCITGVVITSVNHSIYFLNIHITQRIIKPQNYSSPKINMALYTGCWPGAK